MQQQIPLELVNKCLTGDRKAQRQVYDILLPGLEMTGKRYLQTDTFLKDALQDSFISFFKHLRSYDVNKASIKTWATRIMINTCLKYNQRVAKPTVELVVDRHETKVDPAVIANYDHEALTDWLRKMPFPYYEVFNLHVIDGYAHEEIATMIDISPVLSRKRLSRARTWIKTKLQRYDGNATNFLLMYHKI